MDCSDGSDEPGTPAGIYGNFVCRNKGFFPKEIMKNSVGDGTCDCCDGSDELYNKRVNCTNTCREEKAKFNALLFKIKSHFELGFAKNTNNEYLENKTYKYIWILNEFSKKKVALPRKSFFNKTKISFRLDKKTVDRFISKQKERIMNLINNIAEEERKAVKNPKKEDSSFPDSVRNGQFLLIYHKKLITEYNTLGKFQSFNGTFAFYNNGDYCWQTGSGRKSIIEEICWDTDLLLSVTENEPCLFKGVLATPRACTLKSFERLNNIDNENLQKLAKKLGLVE